jgi:hypothetical protein
MAHHFVHGSTFAAEQRHARRGDIVIVGGPAASQEDWARGAVLSGSQSMLFAVRGICGILGWREPPAVSALPSAPRPDGRAAVAGVAQVPPRLRPETMHGPLAAPKAIDAGDVFCIPAADLDVALD